MADDLMDRLARRARERDDGRWDERPSGPLTKEERRELAGDGSLDFAFQPPDDMALAAALRAARAAAGESGAAPRGVVVALPRRGWVAVSVAVALAASAALMVLPSSALAPYAITEARGTAEQRAPSGLRIAASGPIEVILQPREAGPAPSEVVVWLVGPDGEVRVGGEVERSGSGSVRLSLRAPDVLPGAAGTLRVELIGPWPLGGAQTAEIPWTAAR